MANSGYHAAGWSRRNSAAAPGCGRSGSAITLAVGVRLRAAHAVAGATLPDAPGRGALPAPSRLEAPMTHPALINTKFLRMYCASNVGA